MKKQYIDFAGIKSILQSLRAKLDKKFHAEAERVDTMIAEDRRNLSDLQVNKADKATTLEGYGITNALSSNTPYAKSSTVGGSAVSFETSVEKSDKDLPVYFADSSSTEVTGIAAHSTDLSFNPSTGTLKVRKIEGTVEGIAEKAKQFETPATVELTGDVTGIVSSNKDWTLSTTVSPDAITEEKIADNAVSNSKLQNNSITLGNKTVPLGGSLRSLEGLDSVQATTFQGSLKGTADRALADGNGNIISSTYITKQEHQGYKERIESIEGKIPAQASPSNPLVDKTYVADQINAVSAYYITATADGESFASKEALLAATASGELYFAGQLRTPTKNDYCLVNKDESHNNMAARYVYQGSGLWAYQYAISQIALTTAQQKAIDSGVTEEYLATVTSHMGNTQNPHNVTPDQLGLAEVAVSGNYKDLKDVTELSLATSEGTGNAVTDISVSDHTIKLTRGAKFLTEHPEIAINPPSLNTKVATTFNVIDSVIRDENGHVTGFNTTEISLPAEIILITYADLVALRNSNKLVVGTSYRIRDYEFRSDLESITSGNHPFCITVKAIATNMLSCEATASPIPGDSYFEDVPLEQWKLLYSLDNDTVRYPWGSSLGKGIIYYMKDHSGNECCYDFKNLMLYRDSINYTSLGSPRHYYTFSKIAEENSIVYVEDASNDLCHDNKIGLFKGTVGDNIFICEDTSINAYSNNLNECNRNTFTGLFTGNTFVGNAINNTFSGITKNTLFHQNFSNNTIHEGLIDCTVESNVTDNIFYQNLSYGVIRSNLNNTYVYTSLNRFELGGSSYLSLACFSSETENSGVALENLSQFPLSNIQIEGTFNGSENSRVLINIPKEAQESKSIVYVELDSQSHPVCSWLSDKLVLKGYYMEDLNANTWLPAAYEFLKPSDVSTVALTGDYRDLSNAPALSIVLGDTTGNAITGISVDDHTLTIDKSTIFLKEGDIEEISNTDLNGILAIFSVSNENNSI